ncbi:SDR family oxidoreductase [Methylomonas sp. EFPC3]|uniref:SDR family oxidoreductase n=1 Tax=Methylomonas sp. EFPC3 TaxID=3021710 RepID=UPI002415F451|nr:SDR family oxidoreductase [Methylomonas sp. EFPC3]WFP52126.1 SDR family oxidoreductase [Methylomonas sp. EFPC3]
MNKGWMILVGLLGLQVANADQLVLVAGATGRTGVHVVQQLQGQGIKVRALVRDANKAKETLGDGVETVIADVKDPASLQGALVGATAVVSAIGSGGDWFGDNGPEFVDYAGNKNLALAAKAAGVQHMVLVSSMGISNLQHPLNRRFNNVLIWKYLGEEALRKSGVPYTIIRPGGLKDDAVGTRGIRLTGADQAGQGTVNRADVALACVKALFNPAAQGKTFELTNTDQTGELSDWSALFAGVEQDKQ